jgi:hypothetical protein
MDNKPLHEYTKEELEALFMERALQFSCWKGYERVPGTKQYEKGSCRKKK